MAQSRQRRRKRTAELAAVASREAEERADKISRAKRDRNRDKKLSELRAENRALKDEAEELERQNTFLTAIEDYEPRPLKINPRRKKDKRGRNVCVAGALASDWHMEENVQPATVNWLNEYTPEIAQERAARFFRNYHTLIDIQRGGALIDEAILWLGGDLITGYIHPELEEENYLSPIEATELVFDTMVSGIDYLLAKADLRTLHIPCSFGNHGRIHEKKRKASAAKNSYEWGLYHRLRKHYTAKKEKRANFLVSDSYHCWVEIGDVALRFSHGDNIGYQGGVGGISIPVNKAIDSWNTLPTPESPNPRPATCDFMGHFHQYTPTAKFVMNGSLIGWNAYALSIKAKYEEPQQAFFMVDAHSKNRQRVIGHFPIRVT